MECVVDVDDSEDQPMHPAPITIKAIIAATSKAFFTFSSVYHGTKSIKTKRTDVRYHTAVLTKLINLYFDYASVKTKNLMGVI